MECKSATKRLQVIQLYFTGLSFEQIALTVGISTTSSKNIINDLKAGKFPEAAGLGDQIHVLRDLSVSLAKQKMSAGMAAVGAALLKRMHELGLDPSDIERWPAFLDSIKTPGETHELIEAAYVVRDVQKETGLNLPAVEEKVKDLGVQAKELDAVTAKVSEANGQLAQLNTEKEKMTAEFASLEGKYKWLLPKVQELQQWEKSQLTRHEAMLSAEEKAKETLITLKTELKKLTKTGLWVAQLAEFNSKLQAVATRHGLKPSAVRERLLSELKQLDKGLGLETLVANQKQVLNETKVALANANHEKTSLEAAVGALQQQRHNLEAVIQETTAAVRLQIEHLVPAASATVGQVAGALKAGCQAALSEISQLKEESIQVGRKIGQYEGVLRESRWVERLLTLIRGGKDEVDACEVRIIALQANNAFKSWLVQHQANSPATGLLAMNAATFLKELEQWQPKA